LDQIDDDAQAFPADGQSHGGRRTPVHRFEGSSPSRAALLASPDAAHRVENAQFSATSIPLHRSADLSFLVPPPKPIAGASKATFIEAKLGVDLTAQNADISWTQTGTNPGNCNTTFSNPAPITFKLGTGQKKEAKNSLCGQDVASSWNVKGTWDGDNTTFVKTDAASDGVTISSAWLQVAGTASSSTTFKVATFTANPTPATVKGKGMIDDAAVQTMTGQFNYGASSNSLTFTLGSQTVLQATSTLHAQTGAFGRIDDTGLTLLAQPGQDVYFVSAFNDSISGEHDFWSAGFDGNNLGTIGIDPSLFLPINGGYFLPYYDMPAHDVTEYLSGNIGFAADANAVFNS
jgi:hypothetical protein